MTQIILTLEANGNVTIGGRVPTPKLALRMLSAATNAIAAQLPDPEAPAIQIATQDQVPPAPQFINRLNGKRS